MSKDRKQAPLLSDEEVEHFINEWANGGKRADYAIRDFYEAERTKSHQRQEKVREAMAAIIKNYPLPWHEEGPYAKDGKKWGSHVALVAANGNAIHSDYPGGDWDDIRNLLMVLATLTPNDPTNTEEGNGATH